MRAALIAVTAALVALTGCSGSPAPAPQADSGGPVIVPGRPGEEAKTISPEEAATSVPSAPVNAADVKYVQDMVVHHRQAIDMAVLAPTRARAAKVKAIASRIKDSQEPEIAYLVSWLQGEGQKVPEAHHGAAHEGMAGMASPEEMAALKAASGEAFDRLFLDLMIKHHQGAVEMSTKVLIDGSQRAIQELANDVGAGQAAEIGRMRRILAEL